MIRPGPRNSITDVAGIAVGNADDAHLRSGVTVVLPDAPAVASVDVRGGGTGTRELTLLDPVATIEAVDAIVLSGGSAFGLSAADGVMAWLAARGRGFKLAEAVVPIVPCAILFDLANGGAKDWVETPPYAGLGAKAVAAATSDIALGNAGAGFGARAGGLKGGLGSASAVHDSGLTVGALAVVNCHGDAVVPGTDAFWAWPFERDGEFGARPPPRQPLADLNIAPASAAGTATTLVVVATDVALTKAQSQRLAIMAQDGLARAIRPVHTPFDGDVVFALSTGRRPLKDPVTELARIGGMAADCTARAIARGVYAAESLGRMTAYRDRFGLK